MTFLEEHNQIYHQRTDYERVRKLAQIESIKEYGASSNTGELLEFKVKREPLKVGMKVFIRSIFNEIRL